MVRLTRTRALAAERASRPFGLGLLSADILWEGANKLGEHIVLTWISERLQGHASVMTFLEWSVAHPWWFGVLVTTLYLAFICLKAIFGPPEQSGDNENAEAKINQRVQSGSAPAAALGSMGDVIGSHINVGGTQHIHTTTLLTEPVIHLEPELGHITAHQPGRFILMVENTGLEAISFIDIFIMFFLGLKSMDGTIVLKSVGPILTMPNHRIARLEKAASQPFEVAVGPLLPILTEAAQANKPDHSLFGVRVIVTFRRAVDGKPYELVRGYGMDMQATILFAPSPNILGPFDFLEVVPYLKDPGHWSNVATYISSLPGGGVSRKYK